MITFYLSVQSAERLCAGPSPTPDAPSLTRMVAFGEEMRFYHLTIGAILGVALVLQLRALALLHGRWASSPCTQGVVHHAKQL